MGTASCTRRDDFSIVASERFHRVESPVLSLSQQTDDIAHTLWRLRQRRLQIGMVEGLNRHRLDR